MKDQYYQADLDLSPLVGQDIKFILTVLSTGSPTSDRAMWVAPVIYNNLGNTPAPTATPTTTATGTATGHCNWDRYRDSHTDRDDYAVHFNSYAHRNRNP